MEKTNIGFKAGIILEKIRRNRTYNHCRACEKAKFLRLMKPHSPPGGSHVRIRYTSNGETVCCISGKSDTTYQKDKR